MEKASICSLDATPEIITEEQTNEAPPWTETNGWTSFFVSRQDLCFSWVDFSCFWGRTEPLQSTKSINVCMFWKIVHGTGDRHRTHKWPTSNLTNKQVKFVFETQDPDKKVPPPPFARRHQSFDLCTKLHGLFSGRTRLLSGISTWEQWSTSLWPCQKACCHTASSLLIKPRPRKSGPSCSILTFL